MTWAAATPIFRIFDEQKARDFYIDFLGFQVDFEHRFEDGAPLYLGVTLGHCKLHLSEHHGDCCPGASIRVLTDDLDSYHRQLMDKRYRYYRPSIQKMPWGSRDMAVTDPFGNRICFTGD